MLDSLRLTHLCRPSRITLLLLTLAVAAPASAQTGVQFDGSNDYINLTQATSTLGATTFTLEVWFKRTGTGLPTNTGSGGVSAIPLVTKGQNEFEGSNRDMNYFLGIRASDSVLVADFEEGVGQAQPALNHPVIGRTVIRSHTWYHAAAVYNGTGWALYLNGILENTLAIGGGRLPEAASLQYAALGGSLTSTGTTNASSGYFAGVLDEARIWGVPRPQAGIRDSAAIEITSAPGLLGRWGLNDGSGTTAVNSVAGSPDGTLTNGPTWVGGSPFSYFYGLKFNGTSAYVTMGNAAGLSNFTVETWFRRDGSGATVSTGAGGVTAIPLVAKGVDEGEASTTDANYFLGIDGATGRLVVDFEEGAAGAAPGLNHPVTGTTAITNGTWNHAAATYDGTTLRLFLNGQIEGALTVGQPAQSASTQHLGLATALNSAGAASGFLNGALDETRIWNVARTQTDIQSDINSAITTPTTGLVGRWGMNEGANRVVRDTSGSAIHGTLFPASISNAWGWVPNTPFGLVFYDLIVSVVGGGTVSKSPNQNNYNSGSLVQLTASPDPNYTFTGWSGDAGGAINPLSVTMDATKNITATFALTHTLTTAVDPEASGSVTRAPDLPAYDQGSTVQLTAVPATGYHFVNWSGDLSGSTNPENLLIDADKSVTAHFALSQYAVNVTVVGNGSVGKYPDQALYEHGSIVQLLPAPEEGFAFAGWSGDASGMDIPLALTVDGEKNITATFTTATTGVDDTPVTAFALGSIAPNPIASRARFRISIPEAAPIRLSLLDLQGREVAVLADGVYAPGRHTIEWARSSGRIASGMYFARYRTPVGSFTRRVVLAR